MTALNECNRHKVRKSAFKVAVSAVFFLTLLNSLAVQAASAQSAKPILTCKMEVNQYYPDNNGAFQNVLLNTGDGSVTDGNGVNKAAFSVDDSKYVFKYQFNKKDYTYIVFRTTGVMNLIHKFPVSNTFVNGVNYKCEIFNSKPKF